MVRSVGHCTVEFVVQPEDRRCQGAELSQEVETLRNSKGFRESRWDRAETVPEPCRNGTGTAPEPCRKSAETVPKPCQKRARTVRFEEEAGPPTDVTGYEKHETLIQICVHELSHAVGTTPP